MRKLIAIAVIVASIGAGLLAVGCGGGNSADAQQIDKATFVRKTNVICERTSGKMVAEIGAISSGESANGYAQTQVEIVEEALIPRLEEELRSIRALGIPSEAKAEVQAFLGAFQHSLERTKADAKAVSEGLFPYEPVEVTGTKFGVTKCPFTSVAPE